VCSVDHPDALRFGGGACEEGATHALEEIIVLAFDPVRVQIAAAGAFATFADTNIEQQRQARPQADHTSFDLANELRIQAAATALVGVAGVGEAITDHPGTAVERRQDGFAYVLRTRGEHQEQLGFSREWFWMRAVDIGTEQQTADPLREWGAARFACAHDFAACRLQRDAQSAQHGCLASALAAFERDEARMRRQCRHCVCCCRAR